VRLRSHRLAARLSALAVHKAPEPTHATPAFSTELAGSGFHAWRMAFAAGKAPNKTDVAIKEPITFNARDTIDMADSVNSTGNFAS